MIFIRYFDRESPRHNLLLITKMVWVMDKHKHKFLLLTQSVWGMVNHKHKFLLQVKRV